MGTSLFPEPGGKPAAPVPSGLTVPGEPQAAPVQPPRKPSEVTTLFPGGASDESRRLDQAIRIGSETTPSNAGRTLALQRKTGMPLAVVQRNLPAVESQQAQRDLDTDEFRGMQPVVAQWMSEHPLHAAVAMPDLKQMSAIEAAATALKMGWESGRKQSAASTARFDAMQSGRKLDPMEAYLLDKNSREGNAAPAGRGFLDDVFFYGSQFGGQMSTMVPDVAEGSAKGFMAGALTAVASTLAGVTAPFTVGAAIAVGGTYGLAKSVFKQEGGSAYEGLGEIVGKNGETIPEDIKRDAAYGVGAINAAIEVALDVSVLGAPFKAAAKKFARETAGDLLVRPTMRSAMASFGKHYAGALIAEPTQEVAQEMTNIVAEEISKMATNGNFSTLMNDPEQREQAVQRLADIAEQTAKGTLLIAPLGPSLNLATDIVRARNATRRVNAYLALGNAMNELSPAMKESGGAATVAERAMGQDARLYIDVEPFRQYFQSAGVDPRVAAREIWGDAKAFDDAVQGNHALELTPREYAERVAGTPANEFFAKELRRAPDEMNAREAEAFLQAAQEAQAERNAEVTKQGAIDTGREALVAKISAQLEATGQYREQDARDMATQMAHFYAAMAGRLPNTSPEQLAERYPLTVSRGEVPVEKEIKQRRERAQKAGAAAVAQAAELERVTTALEGQAVSPDAEVAETAKSRLKYLETITPTFSDEAEAARLTEEEGEAKAANRARPRTPSGTLKNLAKATDEELFNEYQILTDANAVENTATTSLQTDYGDTWTGMKGGAMKAMGRIAARMKTITKIEAELAKRGIEPGDAYFKGYQNSVNATPEGFSFEQAPRVESAAFRRWFGDSKVVDADGNPLVLYHQTSKDAEAAIKREGFDLSKARARLSDEGVPDGIFLKPSDNDIGVGAVDKKDIAQIPLYARIEKPLRVDTREALAAWLERDPEYKRLAEETRQYDVEQARIYDAWEKTQESGRGEEAFRARMDEAQRRIDAWKAGNEERATAARARATELLKDAGHDGVILEKDVGGFNRTVKTYVVFDPNQVKSATENRGTFSPTSPSILEQPAYHGSPHIFDQFSLHHIGRGEGAQSFGWGLYFTSERAIADYYRRSLSDASTHAVFSVNGKKLEPNTPERHGAGLIKFNDTKEIRATAKRWVEEAKSGDLGMADTAKQAGLSTEEYWRRLNDFVQSHGKRDIEVERGRLYKVEIPEEHTMIDWDAPLASQSDVVKSAIRELLKKEGYLRANDDGPRVLTSAWKSFVSDQMGMIEGDSGGTVYHAIATMFQKEKKEQPKDEGWTSFVQTKNDHVMDEELASRYLASLGVTGIRYKAGQLSGVKSSKATNYVIFDDKLIKIADFEQAQQGGAGGMEGPRGRITFGDKSFNIELMAKADLSTFLHESGHFYLEVMADLAKDAPQIADDYAKIRKYLGAEGDAPFTRDQHEEFARSIEGYFLEGKAPSQELRRVFHRFRTWLMALYRSIAGLNVKLTEEVRGVFDRMFASDAEIAAAEQNAAAVPIFTTAEAAGMTADEFANYQQTVEDAHIKASDTLRTKLLRQFMRERDAWWKEARADVRGQVAAEVGARPVYVALDALRKGLYPDGSQVENPRRLSKQDIVEAKGADFLKRLKGQRIYQDEGGMSLEQASEQFGFTSGDELLQAIVDAPNRNQVIDAETDIRMKAKYGDMISDGSLADEAEAAVLNDHQADVVHAEMRALRRLANKVKPFVREAERQGEAAVDEAEKEREYERRWLEAEHKLATAIAVGKKQAEVDALREAAQAAKAETAAGRRAFNAGIPDIAFVRQIAQDRINGTKVRDLRPMVFWTAARKAARAAAAALSKQDFVTALNEKQHELLNQELYRAALAAQDETDKLRDYAKRLQSGPKQQRLAKAGGGYLEQINGFLERFDFRNISNAASDRRASLADWIRTQEDKGLPVNVPLDLQNEAFRKPWREMTVDELRGIADTLRHLDHLATLKDKLLKSQAAKTLEEAQAAATKTIVENAKKTLPREAETNLPQHRTTQAVQGFIAAHRKLASYLREMDGFVDGGVLQQMIMRPLNEASNDESAFNADATQRLSEIFERHYTKAELAGMYRKEYQKSLKASLSKMGRLMMALNWGTEDNQHKLVAGLGITYGRDISETDVGAVLNTLDARDWRFVQDVWAFIGSYWPQIEALAKRLDGIPPEKIAGVEVPTKFGTIQGGYFPISYDRSQSTIRHHDAVAVTADEVRRGLTAKRSTKAGARNDRVSGVRSPLRLDFGVIREHLADLAQDLTHTEALIDVGRILTGDDVKSAIRQHYGDVVYRQIMASVDAIAAGNVPAQNGFDRALNFVRTGTTIAGLGWNLVTSALQPIGLTNSIVRIGAKWTAKGLGEWLGDALKMENTTQWITEKSPMMKYRTTTQMRELAELMQVVGFDRGFLDALADRGLDAATLGKVDLADLKQSYFWFITRMQLVADIPTWLGAYRKALSEMPAGEVDDAKAVSMADQAVLDSQSGGAIKDLAAVQRGSPALKLWTSFYSFMNLSWNQHVEAFARLDIKKPASVGRLATDLLMLSVVPVTIGYFVKRALRGHKDDDDDSKILADLAREEGSFLTGLLVGIRELSGVIQGFHGYEGPAGARFFAEFGKFLQQLEQGQSDAALWKALNGTAGVLFHYPAAQVQRTMEGLQAMLDDRTNNPFALLFGAPPKQ